MNCSSSFLFIASGQGTHLFYKTTRMFDGKYPLYICICIAMRETVRVKEEVKLGWLGWVGWEKSCVLCCVWLR
jgi:hypothetical protein